MASQMSPQVVQLVVWHLSRMSKIFNTRVKRKSFWMISGSEEAPQLWFVYGLYIVHMSQFPQDGKNGCFMSNF